MHRKISLHHIRSAPPGDASFVTPTVPPRIAGPKRALVADACSLVASSASLLSSARRSAGAAFARRLADPREWRAALDQLVALLGTSSLSWVARAGNLAPAAPRRGGVDPLHTAKVLGAAPSRDGRSRPVAIRSRSLLHLRCRRHSGEARRRPTQRVGASRDHRGLERR